LADVDNPTVNIARQRVRQAAASYDRARVLWVPTLVAGPTLFYHDGLDQNRRGETFIVSRGNIMFGVGPLLQVDLGDALYQPLVARRLLGAERWRSQAVGNTVQLQAAVAYLDLLESHAMLGVNADTLVRLEEIYKAAEAGAKAGTNQTAADLNRAAAAVNAARADRRILSGRAKVAAARLAQLLALAPGTELVPFEYAVVPVVLVPGEKTIEELIATGLRSRPEVATATAEATAAQALVRQARVAPLLPTIRTDLIGGAFAGGRDDDFGAFKGSMNLGVGAVWKLDQFGFGNAATVRGREAGYQATLFRVREVQAAVIAEVTEAAETSAARYIAIEPAQNAVREALEMYQKFRALSFAMVGPKNQFAALEPLTAVQTLNEARIRYLQTVIEFNRSQFRLHTAMGQPSLTALDTATPQPVNVPVIPTPTPPK
jgi:outer membrane protein TolC